MSILVIDGAPASQCALIRALQPLFLSLARAGTTEEAISQIGRDRPDLSLILLDLDSPKVDGPEILQQLQENQINAGIPVIILSSQVDSEEVHRVAHLGVKCMIAKPYCSEVFLERVSTLLELPIRI